MNPSAAENSGFVRYEVLADHVAIITLDRPDARNAINAAMAARIGALVDKTNADDAIRVVILASSLERVFCAGADLSEIARGNADKLGTSDGGFAGLVRARRAKPWIAAVEGAALAGGFEIVLSCDLIVASTAARFGLPEVKRGLYAGAGGPYRLQKVLPYSVALEMIATGDPIDSNRAHSLGMVNRLSEPGAALEAAIGLANAIAVNAPLAVRESVDIARRATDMVEADFWRASERTSDKVFSSQDAQEGARAFLEKRPPNWVGH